MANKLQNGENFKKLSKYQQFEIDLVSRPQIKGAEYNPRIITEDAKKRLRKNLSQHGLVQPLVWNKRTGNLVSGHQRLECLDALEGSQNYDLQVAVIDVDQKQEKILNVQLNNPSMQGDWDLDKLIEMTDEASIDPSEYGFSESDISVLFGEESEFSKALADTEDVEEAKDTIDKIKEHRKDAQEKMQKENSANFYFTVVCESDEQKAALLKFFNVPEWEDFVAGRYIAQKVGL